MVRRGFVLAVLALGACGRASGDPPASSPLLHETARDSTPIDPVKAAGDPAELRRALLASHRDLHLGGHRFKGTSKLRVTENGAEVEALDEEASIEWAKGGDYHALYTNSRDYGREVYFVGGDLFVRPRYGKLIR